MKKMKFILLGMAALLIFAGCGGKKIEEETDMSSGEATKGKKIGVVFTSSGLGDNNFNDMTYEGLEKAKKELGIDFDYSEPSSNGEIATMLREFAQDKSYDMIYALSIDAAPALEEVAPEFPEQKFTIVDTVVEGDNIRSIAKNGADQTFLTGALAGLLIKEEGLDSLRKEKTIGIVIGNDIPTIRANAAGFATGAKYIDPDIKVLVANVGSFSDPSKAKEMALSLYQQGADIILHAAGGSGLGVITAAEDQKLYAMGMGVNQNDINPDVMVSTATFELPSIIFNDVKELQEDNWNAGVNTLGLREGAVGYTIDKSNITISEEIITKVEEIKEWYIKSEVELPLTIEEVDSWLSENQE